MTDERFIENHVSYTDLLKQTAEEASELAQAALKLLRAMEGTNPTPKSVDECMDDLTEEMQDTRFCMERLIDMMEHDTTESRMDEIRRVKTQRWIERLKEAGQ